MVVGVLITAALLVAADRATVFVAARFVARELTDVQHLARPATVTFRGFPFLTQVGAGRYQDVEASLSGVPTVGPLIVDQLDARLHGVRAPIAAALRGELTQVSVEQGEARGFVSFVSMERAANELLGVRGATVTLTRAAPDRVAFNARVTSILGAVTVRGQISVSVQREAVVLRLLPETLFGVPPALRAQIVPQMDLTHLAPSLPFGFRATEAIVDSSGIRLQATGRGLIIPV